jgi:uncharacterized damage-inducible protein DinB
LGESMSRSPGRTYRTGAVGALLDEFERATEELARLVEGLTDEDFEAVRDPATEEEDCRSIQTVVHHVARAGHAHANHLRVAFGLEWSRVVLPLGSRAESLRQLGAMRAYVAATLEGRWEMPDEELAAVEIQAAWGPRYDVEQMLEHAIVHVLRHRRQIERFLAGLPGASPSHASIG